MTASFDILFVIGQLNMGGAERHLLQIAPLLRQRGFRPIVYALADAGTLAPSFRQAGIEVIAPPLADALRPIPNLLRRPLVFVLSSARLWLLMLRRRPAIVHFFLPEAYLVGGFVSLFATRMIRVMSRRSMNEYQRKYPFLTPIERWLHGRMSVLLGNSQAVVRQLLAEGAPPARIALIYNGIAKDKQTEGSERSAMRALLGLDDAALVLILVANLIPYKGHADLLMALGSIRESLPTGWTALCVGRDDGIGSELQAQAEQLGISPNVRFLGERFDVEDLLDAADIGILCSHQEGFSNVILEGMAAGLPMIVTDVGGNAEAVIDGETGLVVPARSPGKLAEAMLALAHAADRRAAYGAAGRARVLRRFSLRQSVDAYAALYRSLLEGKPLPVDPESYLVTSPQVLVYPASCIGN